MTWFVGTFIQSTGFLNEPGGGRRFDNKGETTILKSFQDDTHWDFTVVVLSTVIELFTELHHIYAEWS